MHSVLPPPLQISAANTADEFADWIAGTGTVVQPGSGNDTVSLTGATEGYVVIDHGDLDAAIAVSITSSGSQTAPQIEASIDKASAGQTTLQDAHVPMAIQAETGLPGDGQTGAGGLYLSGTGYDDSFTIDLSAHDTEAGTDLWLALFGSGGDDHFTLTPGGWIRLDYRSAGSTSILADLSQGLISNDGHGGQDQITGRLSELRTAMGNDTVVGSDADESFILCAGNDQLDAGEGTDLLRYDFDAVQDLVVDLAAGQITGLWDGLAFAHQITGVEQIRGGNSAGQMLGDGAANQLEGGNGTDTLNGGAGDDTLVGGSSSEDLRDVIYGGTGNDMIDGGYGNDELRGDAGADNIAGGFGADTVIGGTGADTLTGSAWSDALFGGDGDDFLNGGFGSDRLNGGTGGDRFFHLGIANHGSDWIQDYAATEGDVLVFGDTSATIDQFQVNFTETPGAGAGGTEEAFVIYRPSGQIIWALVDGADQDAMILRLNGMEYDLLG